VRGYSGRKSGEKTPMKTAEEYRQHAEECRRLAELARSAEERAAILIIAASWEELASYRERRVTPA